MYALQLISMVNKSEEQEGLADGYNVTVLLSTQALMWAVHKEPKSLLQVQGTSIAEM